MPKRKDKIRTGGLTRDGKYGVCPQGADPLPLPLRIAKAGRNNLNEEIIPLLPERYSQTVSNLGHAALLRRYELPLSTEVLN
jgi:hypothetical protein